MRSKPLISFVLIAAAGVMPLAAAPQLKYVVIFTRHGVRSPTWETERLNEYSSAPWPEWGVAPGELTPRGFELIERMGAYYHNWLTQERLLSSSGCGDASRIHIVADTAQRTRETARALAGTLMPGCTVAVQSQPGDAKDPLFAGPAPDAEAALAAVRARLGPDPQKLLADHRAALDTLQSILVGAGRAPRMLLAPPLKIGVVGAGKAGVELEGPFATGSTLSEDLLLEYTNGFEGPQLGWGRLTKENLLQVLDVHAVYADLMRRTPLLAQARGQVLLDAILHSIEQAKSGKAVAGALGKPGDAVLVISGHDTNLSNLSGMLGLSWKLAGYQPDDTPPGGALIFSLWRDEHGKDSLTLRYVAQSVDQMHRNLKLTLASPPEAQEVACPVQLPCQ